MSPPIPACVASPHAPVLARDTGWIASSRLLKVGEWSSRLRSVMTLLGSRREHLLEKGHVDITSSCGRDTRRLSNHMVGRKCSSVLANGKAGRVILVSLRAVKLS